MPGVELLTAAVAAVELLTVSEPGAVLMMDAVTPVTSLTLLTASRMLAVVLLAPRNSTWLPLAPDTSIVVAALRVPPA